ncbi:hypothetical protein BOX15_Mlig015438g1 [Macrostomum lignano]|uniref:Uncharacterized protein n=1 Tax=Macrostomum lignano TaxID=282301 RepID=A0A267F779_9PLAT|nr:hypothetical protein BOX15_Mlig015438g1 [Macrostomum lignano]
MAHKQQRRQVIKDDDTVADSGSVDTNTKRRRRDQLDSEVSSVDSGYEDAALSPSSSSSTSSSEAQTDVASAIGGDWCWGQFGSRQAFVELHLC